MSELRRNGGADDADRPAANDKAADKPVERPILSFRTTDMDPERPVNRPLTTMTQRYYTGLIKQAGSGDLPPVSKEDTGYVRNWRSGESLDDKYPNIAGDKKRPRSPFADPPPDINRNNATLEARTGERTEDVGRTDRYADFEGSRRKGRGRWDRFVSSSEDLADKTGEVIDTVDGLLRPPPPTGSHAGKAFDTPGQIVDNQAIHHFGDIFTAVTATSVVAIDLSLKARRTFERWKGKDAGNG